MKMKLLILFAFLMGSISTWAQELLLNDGAVITVQVGATLYVEGGIKNTATGTIDNRGTIELKGNFENLGIWVPTNPNTLKFSGAGDASFTPSIALDPTPNEYQTVVIQKANGNNVSVIVNHLTVNTNLDFPDNTGTISNRLILTGDFDLKLGSGPNIVTGYDANEYVATTGTGAVQRAVTGNGAFFFPIGDLVNYSPLSSTYTGASYTNANLRAKANDLANPNGHPSKPAAAESFISRYWDIDGSGIGLPYTNNLVGTYVDADENGTAGLIKGAVYSGGVWSYAGADGDAVGNTVTGSTSSLLSDFTGTNFYGKVNLIVFLQGAYSSGTGMMSTVFSTEPVIEAQMLNSPHLDAPASVLDVPVDVTDWVKIELRDPASPTTVLGAASAFVKKNGAVVGLDGTSLPIIENGKPTSIVAVFHRNHLGIRTVNAGLNVVTPSLHNFSSGLGQAWDNSPPLPNNESMVDMAGSGVFGLWRGNVNGDLFITNVDLAQVKGPSNPSQNQVWSRFDTNLDGIVSNVDLAQVRANSNPSLTAHIDP